MTKALQILIITLLTLSINACSSKEQSVHEFNNAPQWVRTPKIEGKITGVGMAPPNLGADLALQRSEAMAIARDDIARQVETKVGGFFDRFVETTGVKDDQSFARDVKSKLRHVVKNKLRGARVYKSWMGEKSGNLYLLMVLDTSEVLRMLKSEVGLEGKNAQFQRFLSAQNQKELEKELENYDK